MEKKKPTTKKRKREPVIDAMAAVLRLLAKLEHHDRLEVLEFAGRRVQRMQETQVQQPLPFPAVEVAACPQ